MAQVKDRQRLAAAKLGLAGSKPRSRKPNARADGPRVLVLSGPNLGRLGKREPQVYGKTTLSEVHAELARRATLRGASVDCRQSNHEGELIDRIGGAEDDGFAGVLLNPGALTHTSYALYDALKGSSLPAIEVHVSNPDAREAFRKTSLVAPACLGRVAGFGVGSYFLALEGLLDRLASV